MMHLTRLLAAAALLLTSTAAFAQDGEVREPGLLPYVIKDYGIEKPLTGKAGDVAKGRALAITSGQGNCVICHKMPIPEVAFRIGNVGPDLTEVGGRLTPAEIRMRIVNPKVVNEETIMPADYRVSGLNRVAPNFASKTMLSPEQVEDLVAYLSTLK
jgi:sulfur-oxidizing protein SoxX